MSRITEVLKALEVLRDQTKKLQTEAEELAGQIFFDSLKKDTWVLYSLGDQCFRITPQDRSLERELIEVIRSVCNPGGWHSSFFLFLNDDKTSYLVGDLNDNELTLDISGYKGRDYKCLFDQIFMRYDASAVFKELAEQAVTDIQEDIRKEKDKLSDLQTKLKAAKAVAAKYS